MHVLYAIEMSCLMIRVYIPWSHCIMIIAFLSHHSAPLISIVNCKNDVLLLDNALDSNIWHIIAKKEKYFHSHQTNRINAKLTSFCTFIRINWFLHIFFKKKEKIKNLYLEIFEKKTENKTHLQWRLISTAIRNENIAS